MSIDSSQLSTTLSALMNQYLQHLDIDAKTFQQLSQQIDTLLRAGQRHRQANWAAHMTPAVNELAALGQFVAALHQGNLLSSELYPELAIIEKDIFDFLEMEYVEPCQRL